MLAQALKDIALLAYWHPFRQIVQMLGHRNGYRLARLLARSQFALRGKRTDALACEYDWLAADPGACLAVNRKAALLDALNLHWCNEIDVLLYPALCRTLATNLTRVEGSQYLDAALMLGRGAMLAFGHYGANQMIMAAIGYRGYTMSQISAPPTVWPEKIPGRVFSRVERKGLALRWEHEKSLPVEHISVFGSLKPAFRRLRTNGVLGIALDGGGGATRVDVPFFGRQVRLSTGAAEIALRTGCPILPAFMSREKQGECLLLIEPPLEATGTEAGAAHAVTAAFASRLEHHVRQRPGHYLAFMALRRFMTSQGDPPFIV